MTYKLNTVEAEFAKDPKINRDDIKELVDWVPTVDNMPKVTEYMLVQFYQVCNYDLEKTKKLIKLCYSFKTNAMELFSGQDYDQNRYDYTFYDVNYCIPLPETTNEGYRILYVGLKDFASSKYDFPVMVAVSIKIVLATILELGTCPGYVIVFDVQGFGIGHLLSMHISILRKFFFFLQEASPVRVTGIHVIHLHSIFDKMMKLMSPFMKKELYDMIKTYSTMDDFFKVVPKEAIPTDLDGQYPKTRDQLSEYMVIQFFDSAEHSTQRAKELIDLHYSFRVDSPEFFSCKDYSPSQYNYKFSDVINVCMLPKPTPEGYRLIYAGFKDVNPSKFNFEIALSMFTKLMIITVMSEGACPGYAFVFDIKGIVLAHLASVSISLVRRYLYFVQEAIPLKVKAVHVIHVHSLIDKIMMLAKPFLKKELYDLIYIQSDMNEFYKTVTPECVPVELGGTLPLTIDEMTNQLIERESALDDFVKQELSLKSDESKRLETKKSETLSMNGSFKKLVID
ncbi:hypothetical protein V9T40_002487 [Parthenolecanium corni]|uniref:CRAL-TRIO domain-containing protein n=1 Tax=Parthenolecanium corni TaxID=536013 RepID=A0AAN9TII9_9HEMI